MQNYFKKYLSGVGFFFAIIFVAMIVTNISCINIGKQSAAVFSPTEEDKPMVENSFAWNDNVGWINFYKTGTGAVYVSNNQLHGYAWGENIGWISLNCENDDTCGTVDYAVTQEDSNGILTGYAWGENIGWIDFSPTGGGVYISTSTSGTNTFSGYAWGENIGWISFSGTDPDYGVTTTWTAPEITISAIDPANPEVSKNSTTTFSATVTGRNNTDIIWSLQEGAGTIDESGLYTASSVSGTYTLTATAAADETVSTTTTIRIRGGGGSNPPTECIFTYTDWSPAICTTGTQTREETSGSTNCSNTPELSRSCVINTASTTPIGISINPLATTTIYANDQIKLTATVTGTTSNEVIWNITNLPITGDDYYGKIDDSGLYTAPSFELSPLLQILTINIEAKAKADPDKTATTSITVKRLPPLCTGYDYKPWSDCIGGSQTRTILTAIPANCSGGIIASTTQQCQMTATTTPCISYTYSDWSSCINNKQNRTTLSSNPSDCVGGEKQINEQACEIKPVILNPENNGSPEPNSNSHSSNNKKDDNTLEILNINNIITDNIAVLGTTTEKIVLGAQKILESKTGDVVAKTITTAGVIGGGLAATGVFAINGTVAADLLFLPFKLWALLLSALGLKKRSRPWGTVYDSVTKQPIDPAYVTLNKIGSKEETVSITDLDGRYGFLVAPGQYVLTANKTNYIFPSKKLLGKTEDTLYNNLYFGEEINIENTGVVISKNIPLDPVKFDWNEFVKGEKKMMKFYSKREKIMRIITDWIFRLGFVISLLSLFLVSAPYNYIIFGLYVLLTAFRKFGLKQKALGSLTEKDGTPLSFAIVRIIAPDLNMEISTKVADKIGRYYCLVPKGKYFVKIDKKNDDESYTTVFTSPVFEAEDGMVNKNFII